MYVYCISPTCLFAVCAIIRENSYAIYLKPDIVIKLVNMVSTVGTWYKVKKSHYRPGQALRVLGS